MTDQFNPINVWNKHKYEDRIESVNDESDNLRDGSKFSGATEEHNNDRLQRSSSLDQQPSLAETQREPVNVLPSDFGGYVLHPEHTSNQDSAFKQGADDMISRDQQKQPGGFDFHSMKTEQPAKPTSPPGYQAKPALTHDKDISFFGDCNVATEYQPASRSTLDQDGLHRGSISTLPSAGTGRRASATSTGRRASATSTGRRASANKQSQNISTGKITGSAAKDGGRRPSLMDMATAAVTSVGAVGAAAASGVSSAFMGNNRSPTGYSNVVKDQSSMPSSWPSSSAADNDNSALGISSSISAYPEGPDAKNATNCYYEPAIHGQTACFYTKDDVCNECTEDAEHPFCKHVQEPSIHGQCPSFYCDEKLNDDVFMPHLPVTNVEQSFAAKSQSPRSSLTIDDLPHGFPNHAELPVTNVEQCLNPLDDQINQSSLDKGMSDNNLDQAALPVSNVEQSSKSNDQAPQASLNSDTLNNNNTDQAALPVDNVDQTTSQRSPTNDNGQIGKGLLAGGVGAGAGAAIGGLLSNKNKAGNLDTQEQSQGLNNTSQGATSDGLTSTTVQPNLDDSQLYEKQDDTTVPQDWSKGNDQDAAAASQTLDNDKNNQDFSDAPQNWVDEQSSAEDGSDLPQTWGDQTIPVAPHLSTDSPTGGKRAVSSTPHGYDGDKSITAVPPVGIAGENQSYNPQLSTDTQNYDNQAFQSDQDLVNNFAAGTKTDDQPNKGLPATGGAAAGAALGGALNLGHGNDKKTNNLQQSNVQGQDVTTAPQTLAGSNEPIDTSDSQKWSTDNDQTQGWLSNDDQAVTNDPQTLLGDNDQALLTGDDQGLHGANQDDQGITTAPHTIATGNDKDITAGTQGWSNDTKDQGIITASQAAAIDKGQDVTTSAPWTDNKVDQGNATVPKTWNDQSVSTASNDQDAPAVAEGGISQDVSTSPQTLDSTSNTGGDMNNKSRAEEGLLAGGIGGVGAAAATAGGVLGMDKHKQNKGEGARIDNESFSSTRATTGKIVPDYRNQDEVKDRPMERHENFKGVTDSIDSNRHIQPNTKRKNSLTQSFKAKAAASSAAVTGAFSNAVRRLSSQGSSGSIKKDSIHVRRMSDAEVFKNQTLQDEHPGEQKAFGNYEQAAFGGNATFGNTSGIPPAPTVLHTAANTTDVPFAHDQNAIRTGASAPMDQEHDVIYPAAATATAGVPLSSEENALRPQASNNYDSSAVPAGDNLNETGGIKRTSSDRLKYTGVNQAYARIPGVHSMKPTGTADNGDANFIKNEEERRTTPNMSTFVSGHVETRRGSIQKTVGRIFRSGSMQDKGALKQISGQEKINAYNATHNKL